jgi:hypothetical protein
VRRNRDDVSFISHNDDSKPTFDADPQSVIGPLHAGDMRLLIDQDPRALVYIAVFERR